MYSTNPVPENACYSMCIPWVNINTYDTDISKVFENSDLNIGKIIKIDMVYRKQVNSSKPKPEHYKVFIHLESMNPERKSWFDKLDMGEEQKVNHRFGYWKIRKSNSFKKNIPRYPRVEFSNSCASKPKSFTIEFSPSSPSYSPQSPTYSPSSPINSSNDNSYVNITLENETDIKETDVSNNFEPGMD